MVDKLNILNLATTAGGCHYPWDCIGYQNDCSNCPAIKEEAKNFIATKNLQYKKMHLPDNIHLIATSEKDYQRAKYS